MGRKLEIELPDPEPPALPDLAGHPLISDLRERLARLEERTTGTGIDPAAAEALRLAGETRQSVDALKSQLESLASLSPPAPPVIEVHPPEPVPVPEPEAEAEHPPEIASPEHLPVWHPNRWF